MTDQEITRLAAKAAAHASAAADAAADARDAASVAKEFVGEVRKLRAVVDGAYSKAQIWRVAVVVLSVVFAGSLVAIKVDSANNNRALRASVFITCEGRNQTADVVRGILVDSERTFQGGSPAERALNRQFYERALARLKPIPCLSPVPVPVPSPSEEPHGTR